MTETDIAGLARQITYHPKKRVERFRSLAVHEQSAVFSELTANLQTEVLTTLTTEEMTNLIDHFDLQYAHVVINRIKDSKRRHAVIKQLKNQRHQKIEQFLQFHPRARHQLFHMNYVLVTEHTTVEEVANTIETHLENTGKVPIVLVDNVGLLIGEVALDTLVRESKETVIGDFINPITVLPYTTNPKSVTEILTRLPHSKVVVTDTDGSVLGVVYSDDVIDLIGSAPATSLFSFAGVESSERPFDSAYSKVRRRYRWLILNLGTAFLAGIVVAFYEDTLAQVAILAMYMPIIAGMGSNAATQTLAVMVRGIAIGEISLANSRLALWHEVYAGFINGVITGVVVMLVAYLFDHTLLLGVVAGVSVLASLVIGAIGGTLIPLGLKKYGKDPATSATIFITTGIDVLGFFIFFGLANWLLL
jgi:magnesium transporter